MDFHSLVTATDTTVGVLWASTGVQPHGCPSLLVFRASTTNSQLNSPSHWPPPQPIHLCTIYAQLYSTLSLVSSSLLDPDVV